MKRNIYLLLIAVLACNACMSSKYRSRFHMRRGEVLLDKQKYKRAVKHLEGAEKNSDADAKLLYLLGANYFYLERFEEAVDRLEKAAKIDSENPDVWFTLGNAYYNMDDFDGAARSYRKAVELKTDFLEAVEALAMIYPDGGVGRDEACSLWKKALEMEKRDDWITRAKHYSEKLKCEGAE